MALKIVKFYIPIIQAPDFQTRLYRNDPDIMWVGRVHERIEGFDTFAYLPRDESYSLLHHKQIERQKGQNAFYEQIVQDEHTENLNGGSVNLSGEAV